MKSPNKFYGITNDDGSVTSFPTQEEAHEELQRRKKLKKIKEFVTQFQSTLDNEDNSMEYWGTDAEIFDVYIEGLSVFLMENKLP